jgi:hypothetical protein
LVKVTWLGEDTEEVSGPSFTIWKDTKFPKGVAVEVTDQDAVTRAKRSIFFKVEDGEPKRGPGRPPKSKDEQKEIVTDGADANS